MGSIVVAAADWWKRCFASGKYRGQRGQYSGALTGVLIGLVVAAALGRLMSKQLYGFSPVDPVTIVAAAAIFLAVAVLASLLPAVRAACTTPASALRAK